MTQTFWAIYRRRSRQAIAYQCCPLNAPTPEGAVFWAERHRPAGRGWEFHFVQVPRPRWAPWLCRRLPLADRRAAVA